MRHEQAVIANGESQSNVVDLEMYVLCGIHMPAGWTAAAITFLAGHENEDGGTDYLPIYDTTGSEVSVTTAAGRHVVIAPSVFAGVRWLKLRSGTSGTPVNQGADRTLHLVARPA